MRYLFFGGAFDPIHNGHLAVSRAACEALGFDRVMLVPSADSPHKSLLTPFELRLQMIHRAIELKVFDQNFSVRRVFEYTDIENRLGGKNYTIETVRALKAEGHAEVNWLIGGDTVPLLPTWHKIEELIKECNFVVAGRSDYEIEWEKLPPYLSHLKQSFVVVPQFSVSSTDIRGRTRTRKSIRHLVPDEVAAIVYYNRLYL
jgi:nicotinate-nucleotide adenylyltransferase